MSAAPTAHITPPELHFLCLLVAHKLVVKNLVGYDLSDELHNFPPGSSHAIHRGQPLPRADGRA
eukprot:scaffold186280_cov17-Tisochrysis_lutea.AAC.3